MTWTRLDHEPREPPVPRRKPGEADRAPAGVQALNAIGPLAKGLAFLMGKQPEDEQHPRGFLGLEWSGPGGLDRAGLRIRRVLPDSPAAIAGLQVDDQVLEINGRAVASLKEARTALADVQAGDGVPFSVRRGSGAGARELKLTVTAGKGL
jgi:S1-C subfamily serine protease